MTLPIQLISTDFDGTLHAEFENPPVPHDLQALLESLQQAGAKWIVNTGRDLTGVMEGIARARLNVRPDFLVVVERYIYQRDGAHYAGLDEWNQRCDLAHAELFRRVQPDLPRLVEWISARFQATLYEDEYSPFCLIADTNADAEIIQTFLDEYCAGIPGLTLVRNDVYTRFSHLDFNKGTALREIARHLGIARDHIFAAGDHLNDLPMLSPDVARCLAAPDNAVEAVKAAVRRLDGYVSHQPWGHGVARALEFFLSTKLG
jgi:hydroxymethylpyrimidine pyrophosphatase-like HAD family hydrolase